MGVIGGNKSIITEGLHYYMDPGNSDAYPGTGTNVDAVSGPVPAGTLGASNVFSSDFGGTFNFDGSTDYLQVASNGSTTGFNVTSYTICVWSKPTNTGQTFYDTFFSYDFTAHSPPYYAIHFRGYPTNSGSTSHRGKLILAWNSNGSWLGFDTLILAGDTSVFVSTSWNMYSCTFEHNGSSCTAKLFKNGSQFATQTKTQSAPTFYSQEVYLGKANFATGQYDGGYGPCMFYNKVLTEAEIAQNYNAMKHRFI